MGKNEHMQRIRCVVYIHCPTYGNTHVRKLGRPTCLTLTPLVTLTVLSSLNVCRDV